MKNEIKLLNNSLSIGIDSGLIGLGIGMIFNHDTKVFALTLFGFFFLITLPRTQGKIHTYKMYSNTLTKVNGEFLPVIRCSTFFPKHLLIRERQSDGESFFQVFRFKIIEDESGFAGVIAYRPNSAYPQFYKADEIVYFVKNDIVKGFEKDGKVHILSIVD